VAQLAQGKERDALESFRASLRGERLSPARRAEVERYVISLQRKFAEVEVVCEVPGAVVTIDGGVVGRTPLPRGLVLAPGAHELVLTKDGYAPVRRSFRVSAGERLPFVIKMR
jgi:hypothetical protein